MLILGMEEEPDFVNALMMCVNRRERDRCKNNEVSWDDLRAHAVFARIMN